MTLPNRGIVLFTVLTAIVLFVLLGSFSKTGASRTLTLRIPNDRYDAALFESKVTFSSPNGEQMASKITQKEHDTIIFVDVSPGTIMRVDNRSGDFTGADMIEFSNGMSHALTCMRLNDKREYELVASR